MKLSKVSCGFLILGSRKEIIVVDKSLPDFFLLLKSDLFDSKYYLKENPDVAKAKVNPILHYLKFGWKEGRNPSAKFDGNEYLNKRTDVRIAGICPLVHYLKFGKEENE